MSDDVEGIWGDDRKLFLVETGRVVRRFREQRGVKRASLAADASISEKTLERVEKGEAVRVATYKRIAKALGLPTIEELAVKAKQEREELQKTHNSVPVERLTNPSQLLRLFEADARIIEDHKVVATDLDQIAAF